MIYPVILSGGSGTRLWPLSTAEKPKQFLPLVADESLFAQTLARVSERASYAPPIVVANVTHEALCRSELAEIEGSRLILEPIARNTAVAIVMAASVALQKDPDSVLLVMPSDHRIGDEAAFHEAVRNGLSAAKRRLLVTFGIQPTGPDTGYGYLQAGEPIGGFEDVFLVERFCEKPASDSAKAMLAAGAHFWNGGIFMFRAADFLEECQKFAPDVCQCGIEAITAGESEGTTSRPALQSLEHCPNISVDYAVMERSSKIAMVPLNADWSDVGSWDALADLAPALTPPSVAAIDSVNCYVRAEGCTVALLGVEDLIVVASGRQIVIMKRGRSQDIKRLAAAATVG